MLASPAHIEYRDVEVRYGDFVFGLRGVSLTVARGEFMFLVGRTGSGKSTLIKLVTRETQPTSGEVSLCGRPLEGMPAREIPVLRREMGIVPQDFALLPNKKVWENVGYAMRALGSTAKEVRLRVPDILERVNILHRADAYPHQLSGGEQQRVAIARALINNPPLLLADEPTGNLDPGHSLEIVELLGQLNLRGTTVVVATHDMEVLRTQKRRVVTLEEGHIVRDEVPHV